MNKITYGLVLGGILGIVDGFTAWFTPEVRPMLMQIVIGSTVKGLIVGFIIGIFAYKVRSLTSGLIFGLAVGLFLAFIVAFLQHAHYFAIMVPGGLVGLIVGYATKDTNLPGSPRRRIPRLPFFHCDRNRPTGFEMFVRLPSICHSSIPAR
jgi:MFS family permease